MYDLPLERVVTAKGPVRLVELNPAGAAERGPRPCTPAWLPGWRSRRSG
jgi:hypothetical protein